MRFVAVVFQPERGADQLTALDETIIAVLQTADSTVDNPVAVALQDVVGAADTNQKVAVQSGGTVRVSTILGRGSSFEVLLPRALGVDREGERARDSDANG